MPREISDEEFVANQRLRALLNDLYTDESVGVSFKELIKKKYPQARIPELDLLKPQNERMDKIEKSIGEIKELFGKASTDYARERALSQVREQFGLTDEGMDRVRKVMEEKKISDPEIAAGYVVGTTKPEPAGQSNLGGSWNFFSADGKEAQEDLAAMVNDPDAWFERQVPKIIGESRSLPVKGV